MIYFAVDYRSNPSGLGQIVNSNLPETSENMILISYDGCGSPKNKEYGEQLHFYNLWDDRSQVELLIQFLKSKQVTEVYDSEEGFNHPDKCDDQQYFKLQDWIDIVLV
tara:strand:- start:121 stop:444 length:324 start_codon:yes stop_codon:yes gene_type:complete